MTNPGALAGATGAAVDDRQITLQEYQRRALRATWARLEPRHRQAVKMLALSLHLGGSAGWPGLALVLRARLTESERAALALAALRALDPDPRELAFTVAHWGTAAGRALAEAMAEGEAA